MSSTVPIAFQIKYLNDFIDLKDQKTSRLEHTVMTEPDELQGKFGYYDRLGSVEDVEIFSRYQDTQLVEPPHSRRRIGLRDFNIPMLIDKRDMRRFSKSGMLPEKYRQKGVQKYNRRKDQIIIRALLGSAYAIDEDDAATEIPLPAGQYVPVAATGLTLTQLHQVKEKLDAIDPDDDDTYHFLFDSHHQQNLLKTTEVKSADYNTVKALVNGQVNTFMGFEFIRTQQLPLDANGNRLCTGYIAKSVGVAWGQDIDVDIGPRRDKNNATQILVDYALDGTRVEDECVVAVPCTNQ